MFGSEHLLRDYLKLIRRVSGAESVSLYLPGQLGSFPRSILLHDGESPAVPELTDHNAAGEFCRQVDAKSTSASRFRCASAAEGGWLIRVPSLEFLLDPGPDENRGKARSRPSRRREDVTIPRWKSSAVAWVGLKLAAETDFVSNLSSIAGLVQGAAAGEDPSQTWTWLLPIGGALAWHNQEMSVLLREPISRLPGRTALQNVLRDALRQSRLQGDSAGLLLINPDDYGFVNERFGREGGDAAIGEIADRLTKTLRRSDFVCRYGGAVFGVLLEHASEVEVTSVAAKLTSALNEGAYLDGALRLSFSFGAATYELGPEEEPGDAVHALIRRADQALNAAKLAGGGRVTVWRRDREFEEVGQFDRLSGIFTANQAKDYRNMLLLWDTVGAVASSKKVDLFISRVLEKLASTFHPNRVDLHEWDEEGNRRLTRSVTRQAEAPEDGQAGVDPDMQRQRDALLERARLDRCAVKERLQGSGSEDPIVACAVPLMDNETCMGSLYLEGRDDVLGLDSSDLTLLTALAGQLAIAIDRARLAEQEKLRLEQEQRLLRQKLSELRNCLAETKLVHRSKPMDALLDRVGQVAPTDATVLICGESGTGKELIARTVHRLSERNEKPLVVVDCSAIATTLIDSELFGHERGAYTGAERRTVGRLAEADGGTILLDEIGELPLEVQGKLLRFVQEKQFTPVGGTRPRSVDVRVIAATNRDLQEEVAAGRFREDLFYRLGVVQLTIPPLRERPSDIPVLAQHYIDRFSVQYQKRAPKLSPSAEAQLLEHDWPGNVRELQNRVMQAVILCRGETIGIEALGFTGERRSEPSGVSGAEGPRENANATPAPDGSPALGEHCPDRQGDPVEDVWSELRQTLGRRIDEVLRGEGSARVVPVGRWINDDLVLEAYRAADEVHSRAAPLLGLAETTFRRRLHKAKTQSEAGLSPRPDDWAEVRSRIAELVAAGNPEGLNVVLQTRTLLLEELLRRLPDDVKLGAGLMGVTEVTFQRWATNLGGPAS
jgi:diguanylate cyclase (GGDEF)-like protein